jgi:hypothetical protein
MPETLTAPPPSPTPPAKPAGSPLPPGSASPAVSTEKPMDSYLGDIDTELDSLDAADETAKRAPERARDPETKRFTKQPEKAPEKPQDDLKDEKAAETPTEPEKPMEEQKPSNIRALGKAYDELKKERDTVYKPKLQSLESKVKEYERTIEEFKTKQPDIKPVQEKMTALEKENQQLREVVRFADYRRSPEFTDKYEKPYNEAWAKAISEVTQLTMETEDGNQRKATDKDILALANAPLDQLDDLANKWFPRSSARVVRHVEKIRDLAEAQDKALEEAKKGATEFQSKQALEAQNRDKSFVTAYEGAKTELTKKYSKWFAPDETDPKGNDLLKKGFEYADSVFGGNGNLTPEQRAGRLAVMRGKVANHDRLASRLKSVMAERDEALAKLKEYENSEPPTDDAGSPVSNGSSDPMEDAAAELRKMDR